MSTITINTLTPVVLLIALFLIRSSYAKQYNSPSTNDNCTVPYGKRLLREGDEISINRKLYKVEGCQLQRAYQTCGPHLWYIISVVCKAIDLPKGKSNAMARIRKFTEEKLLSDACCLATCTISEMSRYCP
ncbi:unnamed protein product [Rotaria magnacalcarata]|uniref:Insulin-like domain-containing protein n=1 Tax=Rotaria magnacalcarata TaxID=392030 RepID=A0A816UVS8_9BILA|nr:unnamed protein product [Rotaria magnacalcarata]CAF1276276.1 unnamed protein product [Rotaria magnacalcarata]CAF2059161.1 unnamed protein product [Rotaria magnacalcarata]CAF2113833.1 unnamed protein product [Rotaria magnacalcarata]CAF2117505.1 unnamed protein product [Rotaria magnacalcarata]